ncbi:TetR/AcrR family transcriptional regulator C-terminal domain-containing protein [Brevibacterium sp.]|uniref:TetR/AcrR family transcriptional regulator n=1 Tax=Brevibacterium sp. TaxID=1701 RepID=UPI002812024A|nr:TetR/AcrR family transcriptional regulator C-terminal domain-containing protein [Brevibacterium sp.]
MRLNRERLIQAALDLVDEEGSEGLSMRTLAARVDRQVSSLYNHVTGRGELIELMRARIVEDIDVTPFLPDSEMPWDDAIRAWARSYLRAFAAHPNLIGLLATTAVSDVSTCRMYDIIAAALQRAGWPESRVIAVIRTVEAHVLGSALDIVAPADMFDQELIDPQFRTVHSALDPRYAESFDAMSAFELGLTALVDGLRGRLAADRVLA